MTFSITINNRVFILSGGFEIQRGIYCGLEHVMITAHGINHRRQAKLLKREFDRLMQNSSADATNSERKEGKH